MFWRKTKSSIGEDDSSIQQLAGKLGIERRRAVRVRYPQVTPARLPRAFFNGAEIVLLDISVGGCCAHDAAETLGTRVGIKTEMSLVWNDGKTDTIRVRLVTKVDRRMHIQFLDLPPAREELIRNLIVPGARGHWVKHNVAEAQNVKLVAKEMWSSSYGDSVIIEEDVHRLAQISLSGINYRLFREAWPVKGAATPLSPSEVDDLALFLCNIPLPSDWLKALSTHVELLLREAKP